MKMAATIRSIATEMESSFFSIIIEAAIKMAHISESQIFILHDSSDGLRHLHGDDNLIDQFQSGHLVSKYSDKVYKGQSEDHLEVEDSIAATGHLISSEAGRENRSLKRKNSSLFLPESATTETKRTRTCKSVPEEDEVKPVLTLAAHDFDDDDDYNNDENMSDSDFDSKRKSSPNANPPWGQKGASHLDKKDTKKRCKFCPTDYKKTFTHNAWIRHKAAVHDRRFACTLCDKGFATQWALDRHTRQTGCPARMLISRKVDNKTIICESETVNDLTGQALVAD